MHPTTTQIHHPYRAPDGFAAPQAAVHKASTVIFDSVEQMRGRDWKNKDGYTYGLHGTPTTFLLEAKIATLEHGSQCVLVPSGLAAVAVVDMAFLSSGDEVLLPSNVYGPSRTLSEGELARWGISHQAYDPLNPADLASKINAKTRLVWLEAPGSVTMEFCDLPALLAICREAGMRRSADREIVTALDNTWGAGLAFNAFELAGGDGVDVVIQALTKFPSGGGDVLMGSIVTRREDLHLAIKATHMRTGYGAGANDAEAILRSLPSMALRYDANDRAGRALAAWCATRPEFAEVRHPALASSLGHAQWKALCSASDRAAGLFSVVFDPRYTQTQVDAFCDALQLFKLGYSWAGPISLVVPYDMKVLRPGWTAGPLVRFSMGLEDPQDLIADLQMALEQLAGFAA